MSADLTTTYLGLELECPLIASSSPLTGRLESLREIADQGAAAVVLPSLFEEEVAEEDVSAEDALWHAEEHAGEARAYMAHVDRAHLDAYLDLGAPAPETPRRWMRLPLIVSRSL